MVGLLRLATLTQADPTLARTLKGYAVVDCLADLLSYSEISHGYIQVLVTQKLLYLLDIASRLRQNFAQVRRRSCGPRSSIPAALAAVTTVFQTIQAPIGAVSTRPLLSR